MENLEATQALQHAERLSGQARSASRWYSAYLISFGIASFLFAASFGFLGNKWGVIVVTPLWGAFIGVLTVWSTKKRTELVGMGRMQAAVGVTWTLMWAITVIVGSLAFQNRPLWWICGGLAMAAPCLIGAVTARRRTEAQ